MFISKAKNPPVALEICEGYASGVRIQHRRKNSELVGFRQVKLPVSRRSSENQSEDYKLDERFLPAMEELSSWFGKTKKLSLVLPDTTARTFFLDIENPANSIKELRDIILFKIQKIAPISSESTALAFKRIGSAGNNNANYMALLTSRSLTSGYEKFFAGKGTHLGRIETASLAAINLFLPVIRNQSEEGNFTIARIEQSYSTIMMFQDFGLMISRTRICSKEEDFAAMISQEIRTLSLFSQDQLGLGGIKEIFLCGPGKALPDIETRLSQGDYSIKRLTLGDVIDLPGNLRGDPITEGQLTGAVAIASRR